MPIGGEAVHENEESVDATQNWLQFNQHFK